MLLNHRVLNTLLVDTPKKLMLFDKLNHQAKILLLITGFYTLSLGLSSIFVTLFLFKAGHSFYPPIFFYLGMYITLTLGFVIEGLALRKISLRLLLILSFVLYGVFYAVLVILGNKSADYAFVLGLFNGLCEGFFWLIRHLLEYETTYDGNRNRFFASAYIIATIATIIAPLIAGFFILAGESEKYSGYLVIFVISSLLMLCAAAISFFLKKEIGLEYKLSDFFKLGSDNKDWFSIELTQYIHGLKEGAAPVLVTLVVFFLLKNELDVGGAVSLGAAVALVSGYLIGKYSKASQRILIGWIGSIFLVAAYLILTLGFNITSLIGYILIISVASPAIYIVFDVFPINSINSDPKGYLRRAIYLTSSELWWNFGRITSLLILLILINFYNTIDVTRYFLLVSSLIIPLAVFLYSRLNSTAETG